MQTNRIGIRISAFCLTFLLGFLTVESLVSKNADEEIVTNAVVEFIRPEVGRVSSEPPCEEFIDRFNQLDRSNQNELLARKELKMNVLILKKSRSLKDRNLSAQKSVRLKAEIESLEREKKFLRVEKEVADSLRNLREQLKAAQERESGVHNLLYVENCAEYNEPR